MRVSLGLGTGLGLAVALVAGFVLGGVGPRRELSRARVELAGLTERLSEQSGKPSPLSLLLPVPELKCPAPGGTTVESAGPEGPQTAADDPSRPGVEPSAGARAEDDAVTGQRTRPEPKRSRQEQIEALQTANRARIRQARAALQEQAGLGSRAMGEFDALMLKLNADLARSTETLLAGGGRPTSLQLLGLVNEGSGILYEGQAALEGLLGPGSADLDGSVREIFNYIEIPPAILELDVGDGNDAGAASPSAPAPRGGERPGS